MVVYLALRLQALDVLLAAVELCGVLLARRRHDALRLGFERGHTRLQRRHGLTQRCVRVQSVLVLAFDGGQQRTVQLCVQVQVCVVLE
jgi:hypothetical protein